MTHIRLDDGFGEHQKISCLTDTAYRLYVNGLCYCSRRQTDGFIPALAAPLLMGRSIRALMGPIAELTKFDLWEPLETGGWYIHDYLKHQRSKEQIEQQKEAGRTRLERWRNGVNNVKETPLVTTPEGRGQRAEVVLKELAASAAREKSPPDDIHRRAYNAWDRQAPGGLLKPIIDHLNDELEDGTPVEWIEAACDSAAEQGGRKGWPYIKTTLARYKKDGTTADTRQKSPKPNGMKGAAQPGEPGHCATNTGAGLVVKCMLCDLADQKRAKEAASGG